MEKKLTPTEKLYVIREARKLFLDRVHAFGWESLGNHPYICLCIEDAINGGKIWEDYIFTNDLIVLIPELYEYKPSHVHPYDPWWPDGETEPRLAVLDNLEARYYQQTTWWSRMWFKIRNMFKRGFH